MEDQELDTDMSVEGKDGAQEVIDDANFVGKAGKIPPRPRRPSAKSAPIRPQSKIMRNLHESQKVVQYFFGST